MLTAAGTDALAEMMATWLASARVFVGDGQQRAEVPLDYEPSAYGGEVTLSATFDENTGNFEWTERGVIVGDQVVDSETIDGGRKILGAIWTVQINLDVKALD